MQERKKGRLPGNYLLICNIAGHYQLGMASQELLR